MGAKKDVKGSNGRTAYELAEILGYPEIFPDDMLYKVKEPLRLKVREINEMKKARSLNNLGRQYNEYTVVKPIAREGNTQKARSETNIPRESFNNRQREK